MNENEYQNMLAVENHFTSPVYFIEKLEFLDLAKEISQEYGSKIDPEMKFSEIFPVVQTESFHNDYRLDDFMTFIARTAWNILYDQGYDMDMFTTGVTELWAQDHYYLSGQSEHVHAGSQITGFYILEAPDNSSQIVLHDTSAGKKQIGLPLKDMSRLTIGSQTVHYTPREGAFYFFNSYVPHEFTRNASQSSFKFIHFNVAVFHNEQTNQQCNVSDAEII